VHRLVQVAVSGELGYPQRAARVRHGVRRWSIFQPRGGERLSQPVVERVAVARVQLVAGNPLERVLRMQVERQPGDLGAVPALEPVGRGLADPAERSDVVREDENGGRRHASTLPSATVDETRRFLASIGLPAGDLHHLPDSEKRFPDGAQYRIEIPSTEGPRCLEAVLDEAERLDVRVHRVSQGSGVFLQTDAELDEIARLAAEARVEVSLFARPNAGWDTSAMARSPAGAVVAPTARGQEQVVYSLEDARRAAAHGFRSVLIADLGVLAAFGEMCKVGELPPDMQAKVSVMLPAANPGAARVLERLGASTINLPTDLSLAQIAAIRAAVDVPLDIYVEAPDNIGGFVRLHEIPELIRIAAPVYVKFGLRNAPDVYPAGTHLEATTIALSRERVRRARLGMELLARSDYDPQTSELGAPGLAVPARSAVLERE